MIRLAGWLIIGAMVLAIAVALIGRAIDAEAKTQDHIVYTRSDGVTLDCERITDVVGNVFYDSCVRVP